MIKNGTSKPTIVGMKHVLDIEKHNLKAITDYLVANLPRDRRIGYELTPSQLSTVKSMSDSLERGENWHYDPGLNFPIEFFRQNKKLELEFVPIDGDRLLDNYRKAEDQLMFHSLKTEETNKRLVTEWYLTHLERSANMGHEIKKNGLELSFVGNLHMVDLRDILSWNYPNYITMLSEKETEEDYKKAMKILQGQESKIKKLKEKYLFS